MLAAFAWGTAGDHVAISEDLKELEKLKYNFKAV